MRLTWGFVLAAVLLSSGCGSTTAAACGSHSSSRPAIPYRVQAAIKRAVPRFAYVPTRLPSGSHGSEYYFHRWALPEKGQDHPGFGIWFNRTGSSVTDLLNFGLDGHASCASYVTSFGKPMHQFRINGALVNWSATHNDQQAWSCVRKGRVHFVVETAQAVPGGDNVKDGLRMACLLAYIEPAR